MNKIKISFLGHKQIYLNIDIVKKVIYQILEAYLTDTEVNYELYFGGYGDFSAICNEIATEIIRKNKLCNCKRIFITPYISPSQQKYLQIAKQIYDDVLYPPLEQVPPKFALIKRNEWMVDNCDVLVCFAYQKYTNSYKILRRGINRNKKFGVPEIVDIANIIKLKQKYNAL